MDRPRPDVSDVFVHLQEGAKFKSATAKLEAAIDESRDAMYKHTVISEGRPTKQDRRYQVRHLPRGAQYKFARVSYHRFKWSTYLPIAFWVLVGHAVEFWDTQAKEER